MIPKPDRNSQGSSKESRSLLISADRRMVGCHPMANGHGSNEPETTRTEPKGTDTNRKTYKPTRGNDGGRLAGTVENRRNSNETHPEKRNSRMTDVPGGEPGGVVSASSRGREGFAEFPVLPKTMKPVVWRCRSLYRRESWICSRWEESFSKESVEMQCSIRHASLEATSASTPASRSAPSKKRCLDSVSSARRLPVAVRRTSWSTTSTRPLRARLPSALVTLGLVTPICSAMSTLRHDPRKRRITRIDLR